MTPWNPGTEFLEGGDDIQVTVAQVLIVLMHRGTMRHDSPPPLGIAVRCVLRQGFEGLG